MISHKRELFLLQTVRNIIANDLLDILTKTMCVTRDAYAS